MPSVLVRKEDPLLQARREIDQIVLDASINVKEKARMLGVRGMDYLASKTGSAAENKAMAKLFHDAREEQRAWGIIHELGESEKKKVMALSKIEDMLLAHAVENDPALRIDEKVHYLAAVSKMSKSHAGGLREALRRQLKQLKPVAAIPPAAARNREPAAPRQAEVPEPDVMAKKKIGLGAVMGYPRVKAYAQRHGQKLRQPAEEVLRAHWTEITTDVAKLWAHRNQQFEYDGLLMWGPSLGVSLKDLVDKVAASYLNGERGGLPPHFLQSINGKETNFLSNVDGPAGSGDFQFTPIGVAGVMEKRVEISKKLQSGGCAPLDEHIGQIWNARHKKWESVIQVEKTVRVKVGQGRKARYQDKVLRYEPDFSRMPLGGRVVRGPGYRQYLADYDNSIEMASALLFEKGASRDMTRSQMRDAATDYNGNNAPFVTPEGTKSKVKYRYGKEVAARVKWEESRGQ